MAIEILSIVETWRRKLGLPQFSNRYYTKAQAATHWLFAMVEPTTGDAPNIGHNDGTRLLPLTDCGYRDFRPTVQLAANLFLSKRAYSAAGAWNLPIQWLGLDSTAEAMPKCHQSQFDDGGYTILKTNAWQESKDEPNKPTIAMAVMRYPRYRFRPSHADALHLDFWLGGRNILRDGGTCSYHTDQTQMDFFFGTASHNTVAFDHRDQMPRIGHFLFGRWLKTVDKVPTEKVPPNAFTTSFAYRGLERGIPSPQIDTIQSSFAD